MSIMQDTQFVFDRYRMDFYVEPWVDKKSTFQIRTAVDILNVRSQPPITLILTLTIKRSSKCER